MSALSDAADSFDGLVTALAVIIEIAHYTLVIYGIRSDWERKKTWQNPLATWLISVACCFGGGILTSICVGKAALTPLANNQSVMLMTIVWWHIFYAPKDVICSLLSWKPAILTVMLLKEMIRTRKIIKGVKLSRAAFPDSLLLCTVIGMLGACGGGFVKNTLNILRSQWNNESVKNFSLSPVTKFCLLFSFLYNLQLRDVLPITFNTVALLQATTIFLYVAGTKLGIVFDPFHPLERAAMSLSIDYSVFVGEEKGEPMPAAKDQKAKKGMAGKKRD